MYPARLSLRRFSNVKHRHARAQSSAAATSTSVLPSLTTQARAGSSIISKRLRTRNLLRDLRSVLPRVLNDEAIQGEWQHRVNVAVEDLAETSRQTKIGVWGTEQFASRDLITSMLEEPLSSDEVARTHLAKRHTEEASEPLTISFGNSHRESQTQLHLSSPWLQSSNAQILELPSGLRSDILISNLLACDVVLIVIQTPMDISSTTFRDALVSLAGKKEVHIIVNDTFAIQATTARRSTERLFAQSLQTLLQEEGLMTSPIQMHFVSSDTSLDAQAQFRHFHLQEAVNRSSDSIRATKVGDITKDLLRSGVPQLSTLLLKELHSISEGDAPVSTSLHVASLVIRRSREALQDSSTQVYEAITRIEELQRLSNADVKHLPAKILGDGEIIKGSTAQTRRLVDEYLHHLPWWKLPWRTDDLSSDVTAILRTTYGRNLERILIYHAGRLSALQEKHAAQATEFTTFTPPTSPLNSPLLQNSLAQLSPASNPSTQITPTTLSIPVARRLETLISSDVSPLSYLHRSAQMLLLQSYALSFGGTGAAWAAWAGDFVGSEVAVGAGALGLLSGLRWGAGRWEKAKRRWWERWDRVEEGLERDLRSTLDDVLVHRVTTQTVRAREGLSKLVERREEATRSLSSELAKLELELIDLSDGKSHL